MTFDVVGILFQMIAFLFAISVHESAHAWTAAQRGDPTARMLGRVSLNPIRHIDPIGTILLPVVAAVTGFTVLGWAKPTPVDPRNFRNPVLDDILTSVAGPVSNFIIATGALLLLWIISLTSATGHSIVHGFGPADGGVASAVLEPTVHLAFNFMVINVVLAVFNLIPVPPLDGSHVIRHFLSDSVLRVYDSIGIFGLLALVYLGKPLLRALINPFLDFYLSMVGKF
jgi:Zn-dependent protease